MSLVRSLSEALGIDAAALGVLLGGALILVVATAFRGFARARRSDDETLRAWRSAGTWWILLGVLALILASGRAGAVAAMALLSLLLLHETGALTRTRALFPYLAGTALLLYLWLWLDWRAPLLRLIPVVLFMAAAIEVVARIGLSLRILAVRASSRSVLLWLVGPMCAAGVASLPPPSAVPGSRLGWLLLLLLLTELNDMAQSWWGRATGTHRLAPLLSPGKTWEGLWGGVVSTAAAAVLLCPLLTSYGRIPPPGVGTPFPAWTWSLAIGMSVGLLGLAGDLLASSLKRRAGVKDSGTLLPGHGGVLDRFDSLALTAPGFLFATYVLWVRP